MFRRAGGDNVHLLVGDSVCVLSPANAAAEGQSLVLSPSSIVTVARNHQPILPLPADDSPPEAERLRNTIPFGRSFLHPLEPGGVLLRFSASGTGVSTTVLLAPSILRFCHLHAGLDRTVSLVSHFEVAAGKRHELDHCDLPEALGGLIGVAELLGKFIQFSWPSSMLLVKPGAAEHQVPGQRAGDENSLRHTGRHLLNEARSCLPGSRSSCSRINLDVDRLYLYRLGTATASDDCRRNNQQNCLMKFHHRVNDWGHFSRGTCDKVQPLFAILIAQIVVVEQVRHSKDTWPASL